MREAEADLGPVLWRSALHKAFPGSSGKRKDVVAVLEALRVFRNRLAHHDSVLAVDVPFRFSQMLQVLSVGHLAFYADREIKAEVRLRLDNVEWSEAEATRLGTSDAAADRRLAEIVSRSRQQGWTDGRYQVFVLTRPGDAGHLTLPGPVPHHASGRGSGFTRGQRYTWRDALRRATSTGDLS